MRVYICVRPIELYVYVGHRYFFRDWTTPAALSAACQVGRHQGNNIGKTQSPVLLTSTTFCHLYQWAIIATRAILPAKRDVIIGGLLSPSLSK